MKFDLHQSPPRAPLASSYYVAVCKFAELEVAEEIYDWLLATFGEEHPQTAAHHDDSPGQWNMILDMETRTYSSYDFATKRHTQKALGGESSHHVLILNMYGDTLAAMFKLRFAEYL